MKKQVFTLVVLLLAVFGIGNSISNGTAVFAKNNAPIDWEQERLEVDVFQGTTSIQKTAFVLNANIDNGSLFLTPSLKDIVSIYEGEDISGSLGESKDVTININIPLDTKAGVYGGTLHVREGNRTLPEVLKIKINVKEATSETIPETISIPSMERVFKGTQRDSTYILGEVLISFKEGVDESRIKTVVGENGGGFVGSVPGLGVYQVVFPKAQQPDDLESLLETLNTLPEVELASYSWILESRASAAHYPWDPQPQPQPQSQYRYPIDGRLFFDSNTWTSPSSYTAAYKYIDLPEAWSIETGSSQVKIGVIDTTFDFNHSDLVGNIFLRGGNNVTLNATQLDDHGTTVAGIIGAEGNNGIGATGVMWDSSLLLYAEALPSWMGGGMLSMSAMAGMSSAIDNGARIINYSGGMSSGSRASIETSNLSWKTFLLNKSKAKKVLFVFATENSKKTSDLDIYSSPSSLATEYDNVVSVTGVGTDDGFKEITNTLNGYGGTVTVAAPASVWNIWENNYNSSGLHNGTSFATPMVTGLAGLLLSYDSTLTSAKLKHLIIRGAERGG